MPEEENPTSTPASRPAGSPRHGLRVIGIAAVIAAGAVVTTGFIQRRENATELRAIAADLAVPTVSVVTPRLTGAAGNLVLPGNLEALNSAAINAQTSGYLKEWFVDIGDAVKQGQELAVLDAPELLHQLAQARADYNTALAEQRLAESTSKRASSLLETRAISRQEAEQRAGDFEARVAMANAALANVERLEALQRFTRLTAPFDGVVTSRNAQIGDLVVSGTAASRPLFTISDARRIRVHVRVPQNHAGAIRPGLKATLSLPEYPGRDFEAVVTRSARAVDTGSGSVLVELQADNPDGALMPGAYAQVNFQLETRSDSTWVPGSAVLFRDDHPSIAILGADNRVTLRTVTLGRDEGKTVEITTGIAATDRILETLPDAIRSGDEVKVKQ